MNLYDITVRFRGLGTRRFRNVVSHATHGDLGLFEIVGEKRATLIPLDVIKSIEVPVFLGQSHEPHE